MSRLEQIAILLAILHCATTAAACTKLLVLSTAASRAVFLVQALSFCAECLCMQCLEVLVAQLCMAAGQTTSATLYTGVLSCAAVHYGHACSHVPEPRATCVQVLLWD